LRFKVAGNCQLERKDRFKSDFRFFRYFTCICVIATKIEAVSFSILELVVQISECDANANGLVDVKVMKVGVSDLQIAACTKAVVNGIEDARLTAVTPNNEPDKISHRATASPDSRSAASQIEFAIGTGISVASSRNGAA
jgi:hypothetical protein